MNINALSYAKHHARIFWVERKLLRETTCWAYGGHIIKIFAGEKVYVA